MGLKAAGRFLEPTGWHFIILKKLSLFKDTCPSGVQKK
jgi:hypothetical protein